MDPKLSRETGAAAGVTVRADISIQPAGPSQYAGIQALCRLVVGPHDYMLHFLPRWRAVDDFTSLVALHGAELVGTVSMFVWDECVWLLGLRVHPAWRNRKIAQLLMEEAVRSVAAPRGLPAKAFVLETNAPTLRVLEKCGFSFQRGFSLAVANLGDVMAANPDHRGAVTEANVADRDAVESFFRAHHQFAEDRERLYGEDFIWYPIDSPKRIQALLAAGRVLLMREAGAVVGAAVINHSTYAHPAYKTVEIGKIWGDPGSFLWFIAVNYGPDYFRWYLASEAEEARSRTFGFIISRVGPHERRYLMFSKAVQ